MPTDRERELLKLLEQAAKAAGYSVTNPGLASFGVGIPGVGVRAWNPFTNDGDAQRLALQLGIEVEFLPDAVRCRTPGGEWIGETCLPCDTESLGKAHRRAIVRAAADIGARHEG